ncbi:Xaa-Pro dipeptidase [Candidatus Bilamarchaeum dharawalense]|uniref:Xaa-Pro dipeptidase n=1 Tax=Candidatus Bilamarchaeum dharawalense TaxID=2885759 RepID=A0A5E4LNT0_9ARCH|nr:Xaa-Pro dipeptidase [Candidatus Bilamarchaeum dharawalense]
MLLLYRGENFNANFFYHSGLDIDHAFLLIKDNKKILLVPALNETLARDRFRGTVLVYQDPIEVLKKYLKGKTVDIDGANLSVRMAHKLSNFCRLRDQTVELLQKRAKKKPEEVANIRKAVKITKELFENIDFKKAKTEEDIRKQLLMGTLELGLEPAFEPIVSSEKNTSYPHYQDGNRKIGGVVMVDYGVRHGHYCSDITRCFLLKGDKKKKEQYERLQDILYFIVDSLPNLQKGKEVGELGQDLLKKAGFPKMPHSLGHGVGLDIHEQPKLGLKSEDRIVGSVMAIEPSFYLKQYGMRFEETIDFTGKKARIL